MKFVRILFAALCKIELSKLNYQRGSHRKALKKLSLNIDQKTIIIALFGIVGLSENSVAFVKIKNFHSKTLIQTKSWKSCNYYFDRRSQANSYG